MKAPLCLIALLSLGATKVHAEWIDRSSSIFFPVILRNQVEASQRFPVFWWNFLVVDNVAPNDSKAWARVSMLCDTLKGQMGQRILFMGCDRPLDGYAEVTRAWAHDTPLRHPLEDHPQFIESMNRVLTQASFPLDPTLLDHLRHDPLESWHELRALAEKRILDPLKRFNGYSYDQDSKRVLIPIQFAFQPSDTVNTRQVLEKLSVRSMWSLVGPHASTLQNERQIIEDMRRVSIVGLGVLLIFALLLCFKGGARLVPLFGFVLVGTLLSLLLTRWFFGSVHGLTVSFGTAIVGLAMDYALQAGLNSETPSIWRSNFCGFSTTLVGLLVLMTSTVPLLRQLMFFSATGLAISFLLLYLFFRTRKMWRPPSISFKPPRRFALGWGLSLFFVALSLMGLFVIKPTLDLKRFDFQPEREQKVARWLYATIKTTPPLFQIDRGAGALARAHEAKRWAEGENIILENAANYIPEEHIQSRNIGSWEAQWEGLSKHLSSTHEKFFAPFFSNRARSVYRLGQPIRPYLASLYSNRSWINMWFPRNKVEEEKVKMRFQPTSMREIVSLFPKTLAHELKWMAPLSCLLALLLHLIYFRRVSYALVALLPFFCGTGLLTLANMVAGFEVSFISIIGLVLVFGFSLDYGIFATDACLYPGREGMWTAISLAAFSTIGGFLPLVFCIHPVLKDLGFTLLLGGVGTYLGALYGVPRMMEFLGAKVQS